MSLTPKPKFLAPSREPSMDPYLSPVLVVVPLSPLLDRLAEEISRSAAAFFSNNSYSSTLRRLENGSLSLFSL
jgi:hypothetical protein